MSSFFRGPTGSRKRQTQLTRAFENWFANTPGLKVIVPSNPYDAIRLLISDTYDDPIIFMECDEWIVQRKIFVPIGVAEIKREGRCDTSYLFGR
jgi:pyruvate dehydrogenase E1 component beta subunit